MDYGADPIQDEAYRLVTQKVSSEQSDREGLQH